MSTSEINSHPPIVAGSVRFRRLLGFGLGICAGLRPSRGVELHGYKNLEGNDPIGHASSSPLFHFDSILIYRFVILGLVLVG